MSRQSLFGNILIDESTGCWNWTGVRQEAIADYWEQWEARQ